MSEQQLKKINEKQEQEEQRRKMKEKKLLEEQVYSKTCSQNSIITYRKNYFETLF